MSNLNTQIPKEDAPSKSTPLSYEEIVAFEKKILDKHHNLDTRISVLEDKVQYMATKEDVANAKTWLIIAVISVLMAIFGGVASIISMFRS